MLDALAALSDFIYSELESQQLAPMPQEAYVDMHADEGKPSRAAYDPLTHVPVNTEAEVETNERVRKENLEASLSGCYVRKASSSLNLTKLTGYSTRDLFASQATRVRGQKSKLVQSHSLYSPRASDLLAHHDFEETVLRAPSVEYFNRLTQYVDARDGKLASGVGRDEQRRRNQYVLAIRETAGEREMKKLVQFEKGAVLQDSSSRVEQDRSVEDYLREMWFRNRTKQSAKQRLKSHTGSLVSQWNRQLSRFDEETSRRNEVGLLSKRQSNKMTALMKPALVPCSPAKAALQATMSPAAVMQHYKPQAWSRNSADLMHSAARNAPVAEEEELDAYARYVRDHEEPKPASEAPVLEPPPVPVLDLGTVEWSQSDLSATARLKVQVSSAAKSGRKKSRGRRKQLVVSKSARASPAGSRPRTGPSTGRAGKRTLLRKSKDGRPPPTPTTSNPRHLHLSPHSVRSFRSTLKSVQATDVFQPYALELSYKRSAGLGGAQHGYATPNRSASTTVGGGQRAHARPQVPSQASLIKRAEMDLVDAIKTRLEHARVSIPRGRLERALVSPRQPEQDSQGEASMPPATFNLLPYPFPVKKKKKKTKKGKRQGKSAKKANKATVAAPDSNGAVHDPGPALAAEPVSTFTFEDVKKAALLAQGGASPPLPPSSSSSSSFVPPPSSPTPPASSSSALSASVAPKAATVTFANVTATAVPGQSSAEKTKADVQAVLDREVAKDKELEKMD